MPQSGTFVGKGNRAYHWHNQKILRIETHSLCVKCCFNYTAKAHLSTVGAPAQEQQPPRLCGEELFLHVLTCSLFCVLQAVLKEQYVTNIEYVHEQFYSINMQEIAVILFLRSPVFKNKCDRVIFLVFYLYHYFLSIYFFIETKSAHEMSYQCLCKP